jgi:hypothetical protein
VTRRRAGTVTALAAAFSVTCILQALSCKDDGTHVYVGRLFLEARDCVATTSSVDVLPGDEPGTCDPICLLQPRAEGGRTVYVSTMCPPYPQPDFDLTGKDPVCPRALAALARNDTCLSDGGTTHPLPPPDASADASADATGE